MRPFITPTARVTLWHLYVGGLWSRPYSTDDKTQDLAWLCQNPGKHLSPCSSRQAGKALVHVLLALPDTHESAYILPLSQEAGCWPPFGISCLLKHQVKQPLCVGLYQFLWYWPLKNSMLLANLVAWRL